MIIKLTTLLSINTINLGLSILKLNIKYSLNVFIQKSL